MSITFKSLILSVLVGLCAGSAATLFLVLLKWATHFRDSHIEIIYLLPLAGLLIGWVYHTYGKDSEPGTNLVLDEIHNPRKKLPFKMAPLILLSTVVTHLFGGSAGREGTAVQMGASLADQIAKWTKLNPQARKHLLQAGAGAGFGAAIGAPLAGFIFGLEVIRSKSDSTRAWLECLVASFTAYATSLVLHAPHTQYPTPTIPSPDFKTILSVAAAGVAFGLAARAFVFLTHVVEKLNRRWISNPIFKPAVAGVILAAILLSVQSARRYTGLGLPLIQQSLFETAPWYDPVFKALLTALTIGSGFKGGEFIPLVFIGTTLGSAMGSPLLAAVGFAAVFGAAANTPLACAVMAMEIFGWSIAPFALLGCAIAYLCSGHPGIYKSQPYRRPRFLLGWRP